MFMARMKTIIRSLLRCDFARREDGVIALEAMIMMPLLFWTFLALFSIFDTFRIYAANQKAAFTVSDAISRETVPIDAAYLNGVHDMFEYLAMNNGQTAMRVSVIRFDAGNNTHELDWSQVRGYGHSALSDAQVAGWAGRLPVMVDNERIIVVETWSTFEPAFRTGLERQEITNFVFTRPRYAPQVCWLNCNS